MNKKELTEELSERIQVYNEHLGHPLIEQVISVLSDSGTPVYFLISECIQCGQQLNAVLVDKPLADVITDYLMQRSHHDNRST